MTYEIYADGILWIDPDGVTEWTGNEADAYAEELEQRGYEVEIRAVAFHV